MKNNDTLSLYHAYPHIISQGVRLNYRHPVVVSNSEVIAPFTTERYVFCGVGFLDASDTLTEHARSAITRSLSGAARISKGRYCVVWAPEECTWFDADGSHHDKNLPPTGDLTNPWVGTHEPAQVEQCWSIELPAGGEWSHLCVRRIEHNLVEIAPGEPMVLADFNEFEIPSLPDPAAELLHSDGSLNAPPTYRGQPVTGVRDDWTLLGPVQPGDDGIFLRNPWPDDIRQACETVAGMSLPKGLTDAAWDAIQTRK